MHIGDTQISQILNIAVTVIHVTSVCSIYTAGLESTRGSFDSSRSTSTDAFFLFFLSVASSVRRRLSLSTCANFSEFPSSWATASLFTTAVKSSLHGVLWRKLTARRVRDKLLSIDKIENVDRVRSSRKIFVCRNLSMEGSSNKWSH